MISASDPTAIERGDFLAVLGELHCAINTVTNPFMLEQCENPQEIMEQREADLPSPCIAPVWSIARTRADFFSVSRHDLDLLNDVAASARPREQVVEVGELEVVRDGEDLRVRSVDGRIDFDIIAFVEQHLIAEAHSRFVVVDFQPHSPRVTIDGLVIARERWHFGPEEIPFARLTDRFERFVAARRWASQIGLPRRLFYKIPEEPKPCYLDLASPIYVDLFSRQVRKASTIALSEMLPEPECCWLMDAEGRKYTSELRVAVVDPHSFR